MSYNTELQANNADLQAILAKVNALPEAGGGSAPILDSLYPIVLDKETGTYTPSYTDIMETFTAMAEGTGTLMPAINWNEWEGSGGNDLSYGDNMRLPSLLLGIAGNGDNPISLIFGHAIQDGGSYVYLHYDNTFEIKTAGTNMIGSSLREEFGYDEVTSAEQYDRIYDAIKKGQQVHLTPSSGWQVPYSYLACANDIEELEEDPGYISFIGPGYGLKYLWSFSIVKGERFQTTEYVALDYRFFLYDLDTMDEGTDLFFLLENEMLDTGYLNVALQSDGKIYERIAHGDIGAVGPYVFSYYNESEDAVEIYKLTSDNTLTYKKFSLTE